MKRNIKNLLALADHLDALPPERFDMENYCGTACCIAGHAAALSPDKKSSPLTVERAAAWLGIKLKNENSDWSMPEHRLFVPRTEDAVAWESTPEQAAKVVRHFAKTGRVKWSLVREPKS